MPYRSTTLYSSLFKSPKFFNIYQRLTLPLFNLCHHSKWYECRYIWSVQSQLQSSLTLIPTIFTSASRPHSKRHIITAGNYSHADTSNLSARHAYSSAPPVISRPSLPGQPHEVLQFLNLLQFLTQSFFSIYSRSFISTILLPSTNSLALLLHVAIFTVQEWSFHWSLEAIPYSSL